MTDPIRNVVIVAQMGAAASAKDCEMWKALAQATRHAATRAMNRRGGGACMTGDTRTKAGLAYIGFRHPYGSRVQTVGTRRAP
jgi:hypothetical protein